MGNLISLFFNGWRWDFQVRRKWQFEKFQDPLRGDAVRRDDVFIKENQRLNLIFAKIVRPAVIVCCDPVAPFVDYLEIELGYGARVRFFFCFLTPDACLACHGPGDRLLDMVPAAHPDVFRVAENSREKLRPIKIFICGNFLQHQEHSFEIAPHYDGPEDSIGCGVLPQNILHVGEARWRAPAFFPGFSGLT